MLDQQTQIKKKQESEIEFDESKIEIEKILDQVQQTGYKAHPKKDF